MSENLLALTTPIGDAKIIEGSDQVKNCFSLFGVFMKFDNIQV